MDGPNHERRRHFRGKARPDRVVAVRFKTPIRSEWIDAETRDIGIGGAFIATSVIAPVGTTMTVEVRLSSDQLFALPGVVRWATDGGMGVQFVGVDVDVLLELNDFFSSITT